MFIRFGPEFAIVFAAVLSLNGQEWYHDRFGVRGRLGAGWTLWSTGGRLVTLAALFFCVAVGITGWRKAPDDPRFGFGYDANEFPFEAAEYLARREDIKGNVLNTTLAQGDALIWKAYPTRKTFLDGRAHLFPRELLDEHHKLRNALRDDEVSAWKPELDKYGITAVMIESSGAPNTYRRLMQSPNWIPFYDDGRVVMFGRADAAEPDRDGVQEQPARARAEGLQGLRADPHGRSAADADVLDRRHLPEPPARPSPVAHQCRRPLAPGGEPRRGPARHPGPGPLHARHPRSAHRAGQEPRRLARLPPAQRGLSAAHAPGDGPPGGHPAHAREPGPDRQADAEHRGPQHPVPPAGHGPQLRDPDHAPAQDPRGAARAPVA